MVDNNEHVLIGFERDKLSVEGDGPDLVGAHIEYFNLLFVSNCQPSCSQCHSSNVVPADLPGLSVDAWGHFDAYLFVCGVS